MALIRGEQITGSVASASYSVYAVTASYALNAGGATQGDRIVTGSVTASVDSNGNIFIIKSGSQSFVTITNTGTIITSGSADNLFIIKGSADKVLLSVSQSGVITLATQSSNPVGTAPNGGLTFTSTDFFVGLD